MAEESSTSLFGFNIHHIFPAEIFDNRDFGDFL